MKTLAIIVCAAALVACGKEPAPSAGTTTSSGAAAAGTPIAVVNGDFEQSAADGSIPGWMTLQHNGVLAYEMKIEPDAAYHGHGGFRMTRTREQVYGTLAQNVDLPQPSSGEIELSAMLKSRDTGAKGWALMLIVGEDVAYSPPLTGTQDWQRLSVRAKLKPDTRSVRIGVTLIGAGTGWADDIQLRAIAP